jgi:hypothetical protein
MNDAIINHVKTSVIIIFAAECAMYLMTEIFRGIIRFVHLKAVK